MQVLPYLMNFDDQAPVQAAADRLSAPIIRKRLDYWTGVVGPQFSKAERAAIHRQRAARKGVAATERKGVARLNLKVAGAGHRLAGQRVGAGSNAERAAVETARIFTSPEARCGVTEIAGKHTICTSSRSSAVIAPCA